VAASGAEEAKSLERRRGQRPAVAWPVAEPLGALPQAGLLPRESASLLWRYPALLWRLAPAGHGPLRGWVLKFCILVERGNPSRAPARASLLSRLRPPCPEKSPPVLMLRHGVILRRFPYPAPVGPHRRGDERRPAPWRKTSLGPFSRSGQGSAAGRPHQRLCTWGQAWILLSALSSGTAKARAWATRKRSAGSA
jgi:hypothetical protein